MKYYNPEDFLFGAVINGTTSGNLRDVLTGKSDLMIAGNHVLFEAAQVRIFSGGGILFLYFINCMVTLPTKL